MQRRAGYATGDSDNRLDRAARAPALCLEIEYDRTAPVWLPRYRDSAQKAIPI
jgi:hypothetical protein